MYNKLFGLTIHFCRRLRKNSHSSLTKNRTSNKGINWYIHSFPSPLHVSSFPDLNFDTFSSFSFQITYIAVYTGSLPGSEAVCSRTVASAWYRTRGVLAPLRPERTRTSFRTSFFFDKSWISTFRLIDFFTAILTSTETMPLDSLGFLFQVINSLSKTISKINNNFYLVSPETSWSKQAVSHDSQDDHSVSPAQQGKSRQGFEVQASKFFSLMISSFSRPHKSTSK